MKKYRKVIALLLALATVSDAVPVITSPVTVEAASAIKLSKSKLTMGLGDSYTLKLAGAKNPIWKSSNSKIAVVKNGKVIARKSGKVTISATYKGKSYKCTVLVKAPKISSAKFSMTVGTKKQVRVLNTINRVAWFTSNKSVAVVDKKGLVTARKAGKVKITGKLHGKRYTSVITVKKSLAKPVTLSKKSAKVLVGSSLQLKLNNAASSKVVWKTSNKSIATVSKGKVVPKKSGKVTITAVYNKRSYKCTVVIPKPAIISSDGFTITTGKSLALKTANTKGKVTWKSSDPSVATINSLGKVTAKKTGKTTISAVVGSCTIKKNIEVVGKGDYTSETISVIPGETLDIAEGTVTDYTKGLVSINGRTVKMLKPGTARVTVKSKSGIVYGYEFKIKKSYLNQTELQLGVGFSDLLDLLDNKLPITWSSSNPAIVTVDADGIVVGKKKGTAVITGLAGGVEYTCKVTVTGGNGNTGNNGSNSNNGSNGNNGNGSNGSTGNTGSTTNKPGSGNNGSTGSNGNTGSTGSTGTTTNKPSTVIPDSKAEIKRYDWNEICNTDYNQLGKLVHNSKMQIIIDNAPGTVKYEVEGSYSGVTASSAIAVDKNGVITTKADTTKAADKDLAGYFYVKAICGDDYAEFGIHVKALEWTVPNKKIYSAADPRFYNVDIPQEARSDVFDYFFGHSYNTVKANYEVLYGAGSPYLDFGSYAVKMECSSMSLNLPVYESSARMDAVFGWLKNKPDYVKVREVARWMNSHITYGGYTSDGTFLGMKTGVCSDTALEFYEIMWYLGVKSEMVGVSELDHEWNMVQLDGYWYSVDVTAPYQLLITLTSTLCNFDTEHNNLLASQGYFSKHPYGTKYLYGCKVFAYNSIDALKADYNNKSSALWQEYNTNGGVAVNIPSSLKNDAFGLVPGVVSTSAYQNSLANTANVNDKSRETLVSVSNELKQLDTTPLPALSNYLN